MRRNPGFRNALVQIFAGGNTMMLERATGRMVLHNWWLYQLISGTGAQVIYDEVPLLLYRQHGTNQVGASTGAGAKLRRMLRGRFHRWNGINLGHVDKWRSQRRIDVMSMKPRKLSAVLS